MASRQETNFKRLLNRCEAMASEKDEIGWRLEKYVGALQQLLSDLRKDSGRPAQDTMTEYKRRVDFLKGLTEAEQMVTASEKLLAAEMLAPASRSAENSQPSRELHLQKKAHYQNEMRDELLGLKPKDQEATGSGVRQRQVAGQSEEDLDTVLKHHNQIQEKLADEMLSLARNLKDNATAANRIVKGDNKKEDKDVVEPLLVDPADVIGESACGETPTASTESTEDDKLLYKLESTTKLADSNFGKLKVESDRLETHVKKGCNWWILIMLALVGITFIWMVLFMKMFPKR